MNEKFCILITNQTLKFVPDDPTDNKSVLVQVMAWEQIGNKPLSRTNVDPVHGLIYATQGGDELTHQLALN